MATYQKQAKHTTQAMHINQQQMASSTELFIPVKFNTSVQLKPNELGPNIEDIIQTKLKTNLENMCSKHGFIRKGSIKIIKRSAGQIKVAHFNGNVAYEIYCVAEICNPAQGSIIKCRVKAKNSLGLLANGFYDNIPILEIIVPKISAGIQSEINIETVNIGDEISIEVVGKKFQLYDKYISIIGKAMKESGEQLINNVIVQDEALFDAVEIAEIGDIIDDNADAIYDIDIADAEGDVADGADGAEAGEVNEMPDDDVDDDIDDDLDDEEDDDDLLVEDNDFESLGDDIGEFDADGGDFEDDF
jgi:DNA-directed RNA polymerase subunit E'/Rpb7